SFPALIFESPHAKIVATYPCPISATLTILFHSYEIVYKYKLFSLAIPITVTRTWIGLSPMSTRLPTVYTFRKYYHIPTYNPYTQKTRTENPGS
ncbi:MAG: hypothetical protein QXX32_05945, partial [Thermofilum sp.]